MPQLLALSLELYVPKPVIKTSKEQRIESISLINQTT